jgi:hypothetical protein
MVHSLSGVVVLGCVSNKFPVVVVVVSGDVVVAVGVKDVSSV